MNVPVVKILCHPGAIQTVAIDSSGRYFVTTGVDCRVKIWDIRNLQLLDQYKSNSTVTCTDISQKGLLALGYSRRVEIWKDVFTRKQESPYLNYTCAPGS